MKLVQLNAWGGRLETPLLNFLVQQNPDIICLQEIFSIQGNSGFFMTIEKIQRELEVRNVFMSPVYTINFMRRKAMYGNAIASKLPFSKSCVVFTNLEHSDNFDFDKDDYNIRNLQLVRYNLGGKTLNVLNHHGHHLPKHKDGDSQTMRQMQIIEKQVDKLDGAVILAGDFNLTPDSESLESLNKKLVNLSVKYNLQTTRTHLTSKKEVCDYIFVSKDVKINNFFASDQIVSDHQALILDFEL